jgi:co-chaperonin GroES (HSP10)
MKYIPLGDRVIVRPLTDEESAEPNASGIFLPDAVKQENQAIVVAVGEGVYDSRLEKNIPPQVEVGDRIVHANLHGWKETIKYDGIDCYIINESNILAYVPRS